MWSTAGMRSFAEVIKGEPSVGDVHITTAIGNSEPKRRPRSFLTVLGMPKAPATFGPTPVVTATSKADSLSAAPMEGLRNRRLEPFDVGTMHVPFRYSAAALSSMRPDQVPRFLDAVTHPKRLMKGGVPLSSLYAIKDRVGRDTVEKHLETLGDGDDLKLPVVVKLGGANHIADGHDRLAASWLNGDDIAAVRYLDLDPVSEAKPDPTDQHKGSKFDLLQPNNGRRLSWNPNGTLAVPFGYNPAFFAGLRADQLPRFLYAVTHQKSGDKADVPLSSLRAIQDRVNPDTVAAHRESPTDKRPVIVKVDGVNYIGDGHDRLTARWLDGDETAAVRLTDLGALPNNAMKRLAESKISFEVKKADPEQQMIFGWASVVTKDGRPIVDHQGDVIPVEELEKAFYDYVLSARAHGHMHSTIGTGRLVECMVFTKQKQDLLRIIVKDDDGHQIEGAWVGYRVDDAGVWAAHKRGELPEFSIGGAAVPVVTEITDAAS